MRFAILDGSLSLAPGGRNKKAAGRELEGVQSNYFPMPMKRR